MTATFPPGIDYRLPPDLVTEDIFAADDVPTNWAFAHCNIAALRELSDGTGVKVGVVDTGINARHPQFASGRVTKVRSFTGEDPFDGHGHGSHVAGTIGADDPRIGASQGCELLIAKALTNGGGGRSDQIGAAFQWLADEGCHIINASIGGPSPDPYTEKALAAYAKAGGIPIIAGGNERQAGATLGYPGAYPFVLAVAATDAKGNYAPFSNPGKNAQAIAIAAPGVAIDSVNARGGYARKSGTSMATPLVAGIAALYVGYCLQAFRRRPTAEEFRRLFRDYALDAGRPGLDTDFGPGVIRCDLIAATLRPAHPPVA